MAIVKKYSKFIIVLVVALAILIVYFLLYQPLKGQVEDLRFEVSNMSYEDDMEKIRSLPTLEADIEAKGKETTESAGKFYGDFTQEQFFVELDRLVAESEIRLLSLSSTEASTMVYDASGSSSMESEDGEENQAAETTSAYAPQVVTLRTFNLSFESDYDQLTKLMELIDEGDKRIVCEQISISQGGGDFILSGQRANLGNVSARIAERDGELSCSMQLDFYALVDMDEYAISSDYVNILEQGNILKTGDYSPFVRVMGP